MAIWVNPKKKSYTSTGPTAWLKRYVEFMVEMLQTEVRGKLKTFPIQPSGEEGGAVIHDVADRTYDEDGNLIAGNEATGKHALAAGTCTTATGDASAAVGEQVTAEGDCQLVHGRYNLPDKDALHIVGNGVDEENRSNAYLLDKEGNGWFKGNVTVGKECLELATKVWSKEVLEEEAKKKLDITWIKRYVNIDSDYVSIDEITEPGLYGLQAEATSFAPIVPGSGENLGETIYEDAGKEYLIVTQLREDVFSGGIIGVNQVLFSTFKGIKLRSGTISEDGTVTWEDWKEYVTKEILEDELNQKADITWIDIQADSYDTKESYLYPLLDTITDNGFYGIRPYEVLHGGEDGNEEFHVPIYTEYLMVSTRGNYSDEITQMYLDSEQGLRIRHGKRRSDNTVAWDEWNEQFDFDYVDRTSEQDITGRKHFMDGISVTELGAINTDLTIRAADSLRLNCDGDMIFEGGKIGQTSVLAILNEIEALKNRIADLESVNADLENIITLQEDYIGGEEA